MQPSPKQAQQPVPSVIPVILGIVAEIVLAAVLFLPSPRPPRQLSFLFWTQIPYALMLLMLARCARNSRTIKLWAIVASALGTVYAVLAGIFLFPLFLIALGFGSRGGASIFLGLFLANLYVAFAAAYLGGGGESRQSGSGIRP